MLARVCALLCVIALPICAVLWHRSHAHPEQRRFDLTLYKSAWLYLSKGMCAVHVLSMPMKTPSRSRFQATFNHQMIAKKGSLALTSQKRGEYRDTWLVFPMWLPTSLLAAAFTVSMLHGPYRVWSRRRRGCCIACGYSLYGNRGGRCPECGLHESASALPARAK